VPRTSAPAKINWTLEALGRRPDGYHAIASVMSTISLADELELTPSGRWALSVAGPAVPDGGLAGDDNLVRTAAAALVAAVPPTERARAGWGEHGDRSLPPFQACLVKRIPAAAGLGGGSSDAAAALRLLARVWQRASAGAAPDPEADPVLYRVAAGSYAPGFRQIGPGGNAVDYSQPGYDLITGLGSPNVFNLARNILALQRGVAPR
jgi:hypothetical protein